MKGLTTLLVGMMVCGLSVSQAGDAGKTTQTQRGKLKKKSSKRSPRLPDVLPIQPIYSQWGGGHGTEGRLFHTPTLTWAFRYDAQELEWSLYREKGWKQLLPEAIIWSSKPHIRETAKKQDAFMTDTPPFQMTGYAVPIMTSADSKIRGNDFLITQTEVYDMKTWFLNGIPQSARKVKVWQEANTGIYAALPVVLSNYQPPPGCDPAAVYVLVDTSNRVGILAYDLPKGKWVATKYPKPVQLTEHYARDQAGNNVYIGTNRGRLVYDSKHRTLTLDRQPLRRKPSPKVAHK